MSAAFTPGPWAIDGFNLGAVIVKTDERTWESIAECGVHQNWRENARLIAAAPDLYSALKDAAEKIAKYYAETEGRYAGGVPYDMLRPRMEAALAKAEGRS